MKLPSKCSLGVAAAEQPTLGEILLEATYHGQRLQFSLSNLSKIDCGTGPPDHVIIRPIT
ncbi:hypothetical protein QC763_0060820 [Podospora pseudopauciseta]|uniref:Uncharacterized protein n=1 Tax=Podospora pseudopauciseta TaxID=2093780 RepID=A0ABR0HBP2_9PEZI|nr:hypothetical protein QC763_0060820 [Podospora pseudopauciseta]